MQVESAVPPQEVEEDSDTEATETGESENQRYMSISLIFHWLIFYVPMNAHIRYRIYCVYGYFEVCKCNSALDKWPFAFFLVKQNMLFFCSFVVNTYWRKR